MDTEYELYDIDKARFEVDQLRFALNAARRRAAAPLWGSLIVPVAGVVVGAGLIALGAPHLEIGTPADRLPLLIGAIMVLGSLLAGYIRFDTRDAPKAEVENLGDRLRSATARVTAIVEAQAERDAASERT